ncbi:hypothetical protein N9W89_09135 [Hellea sp.]|nr:hypothetical protein [Hellea sp.]
MKVLQILFLLGASTACSACHTSSLQSPIPDTDFSLSSEALDKGFSVKLENTSANDICIFAGDWPAAVKGGLPGITAGNYVGHTSALPYIEIGEQKFKYARWLSVLGHSSVQRKIEPSEIIETILLYADFSDLPENRMDAELRYPITALNCR